MSQNEYKVIDPAVEFADYAGGEWFACDPDEDEAFGVECGFVYEYCDPNEEVWCFDDE